MFSAQPLLVVSPSLPPKESQPSVRCGFEYQVPPSTSSTALSSLSSSKTEKHDWFFPFTAVGAGGVVTRLAVKAAPSVGLQSPTTGSSRQAAREIMSNVVEEVASGLRPHLVAEESPVGYTKTLMRKIPQVWKWYLGRSN